MTGQWPRVDSIFRRDSYSLRPHNQLQPSARWGSQQVQMLPNLPAAVTTGEVAALPGDPEENSGVIKGRRKCPRDTSPCPLLVPRTS